VIKYLVLALLLLPTCLKAETPQPGAVVVIESYMHAYYVGSDDWWVVSILYTIDDGEIQQMYLEGAGATTPLRLPGTSVEVLINEDKSTTWTHEADVRVLKKVWDY
jgi:hypothetical protein